MNKHMVGVKTKYSLKETQAKNNTEILSDAIQTTHPSHTHKTYIHKQSTQMVKYLDGQSQ
jgi:hypothetical protein